MNEISPLFTDTHFSEWMNAFQDSFFQGGRLIGIKAERIIETSNPASWFYYLSGKWFDGFTLTVQN